ncbi:MAG: hypothetical protein AB7O56_15020 [Bauldia sp.]
MKNVTITLDEKVAQWARVEAAKAGKSLSSWIGERLDADMQRDNAAASALTRWLDAPLWESVDGPLPSREELYEQHYDRPGFRGHEYSGLHEGPTRPLEGEPGGGVAKRSRRRRPAGREPTGSE